MICIAIADSVGLAPSDAILLWYSTNIALFLREVTCRCSLEASNSPLFLEASNPPLFLSACQRDEYEDTTTCSTWHSLASI
jgi:hypothetical protein